MKAFVAVVLALFAVVAIASAQEANKENLKGAEAVYFGSPYGAYSGYGAYPYAAYGGHPAAGAAYHGGFGYYR